MSPQGLHVLEELAELVRERRFPDRYQPRATWNDTSYILCAVALVGEVLLEQQRQLAGLTERETR